MPWHLEQLNNCLFHGVVNQVFDPPAYGRKHFIGRDIRHFHQLQLIRIGGEHGRSGGPFQGHVCGLWSNAVCPPLRVFPGVDNPRRHAETTVVQPSDASQACTCAVERNTRPYTLR
jgi:hypothetical protein